MHVPPFGFAKSQSSAFPTAFKTMIFTRSDQPLAALHTRAGLDVPKHDSLVETIVRLNVAFMAAIVLVIGIRLYVRWRIVRRVGSDDVLMVFATIFTVVLSAMCIFGTKFGLGRHELDLNPVTVIASTKNIVKILLVCQVLYATAVTLTKASIIASYLRVLPTPFFRWLMHTTAAVIIAMWICSVFVTTFQCHPIEGAWDFTLKHTCVDITKYFYIASSINIATDLVLCTSPLPLFWKLNISTKERIILCMLFGAGLFATAASGVRLSQLHNLGSFDLSYACVTSLNWSVVEVGTGIICASVPSVKPLLNRLFPGEFFTRPRGSRWTSNIGPSLVQSNQQDAREVEMGTYPQKQPAAQKARLGSMTQVVRNTSTESFSTKESGEERLVPAASKQKLNDDVTEMGPRRTPWIK